MLVMQYSKTTTFYKVRFNVTVLANFSSMVKILFFIMFISPAYRFVIGFF